jgi:hypothetical protein
MTVEIEASTARARVPARPPSVVLAPPAAALQAARMALNARHPRRPSPGLPHAHRSSRRRISPRCAVCPLCQRPCLHTLPVVRSKWSRSSCGCDFLCASPLSPAFTGQRATWERVLQVQDLARVDHGQLQSWPLDIVQCSHSCAMFFPKGCLGMSHFSPPIQLRLPPQLEVSLTRPA